MEFTDHLESLSLDSPNWDLLDNILHTLLASPSLPEKTLDICRYTCSQLISADGRLTAAVNSRSVHRLFNVLVNIGNLMHRIDSTIPATVECYMHAIEVVVQPPHKHHLAGKITFQDFVIAAWVTSMALSFVRESYVPSYITQSLKAGSPVNVLSRVGDYAFDIIQTVHDAGDELIRALVDPSIGTLPNVILLPDQVHNIAALLFPSHKGPLPGVHYVDSTVNERYTQETRMATASVLLSLARRFQSSHTTKFLNGSANPFCTADALVLILHYVAVSLFPNASTFNDIGVILCGLGPGEIATNSMRQPMNSREVARLYYERGLQLDPSHPHLLSNLGSLLKDAGYTNHAIGIFNHALMVHPELDIALVNMANTLKDTGQCAQAVSYYLRAISVNPDFSDAYCGLSHSMNAVCQWNERDVWMQKAISVCERQIADAYTQDIKVLRTRPLDEWLELVRTVCAGRLLPSEEKEWTNRFRLFMDESHRPMDYQLDEAGFFLRLMEWCQTRIQHSLYIKLYGHGFQCSRPQPAIHHIDQRILSYSTLLSSIKCPKLPFILPFHTFTLPLTARAIRLIAHRNALNTSFTAMTHTSRNLTVYRPPPPPLDGRLRVGYVSSDFNDHPLTHLMKSVFSMHSPKRFEVFLYATSPTDGSAHRQHYESQVNFHFTDVSTWSIGAIVDKIVEDQIHILVNLGGYTKGAKNEVFAARPCPVQVSLMGYAGTLAAGWCDYLVCDTIACPPDLFAHACTRNQPSGPRTVKKDIGVPINEENDPASPAEDWIYTECPIFMPHTYFVADHKQSYRQDQEIMSNSNSVEKASRLWTDELHRREELRKSLFPDLPRDVVVFANFNQLYKIDPIIFWTWLRILSRVRRSILWLLRFPDAGEPNLLRTASAWAGDDVASRIRFTDVAPKEQHISRCRVADLVLDTAECSAHTIAADVLWSGTPLIACAWPSHKHKMSSRVAASVAYATGLGKHMVVHSREEYEDRAVTLGSSLKFTTQDTENRTVHERRKERREQSMLHCTGELLDLRRRLFLGRGTMPLFDTMRWVKNLEKGYNTAWKRWVDGSQFRTGGEEERFIAVRDEDDVCIPFS